MGVSSLSPLKALWIVKLSWFRPSVNPFVCVCVSPSCVDFVNTIERKMTRSYDKSLILTENKKKQDRDKLLYAFSSHLVDMLPMTRGRSVYISEVFSPLNFRPFTQSFLTKNLKADSQLSSGTLIFTKMGIADANFWF